MAPGTGVSPVGKRDPAQLPNISGNGIAVALMCAVLHQYRPVAANEGGLTGKADISLEMGPTGDLVAN